MKPIDAQTFVNVMNQSWRDQRSKYQITIGKLIDHLEKEDPLLQIFLDWPETEGQVVPDFPHSYRGYYSDVAFEPAMGQLTVAELLKDLQTNALNQTFTGWKGGDFYMDSETPVWISEEGTASGRALIAIEKTGTGLIFKTKKVD